MSRRAIPLLATVLLSVPAWTAPVPSKPKPDDTVSPAAAKLLQHRKVQKELKLTAEQRIVILDGLADIDEEFEKKTNELARQPNPPDEAYDKLEQERDKAIEKVLTDSATKSLSAGQRGRLRQLDWRVRGAAAFTDPRVEKKLQLTEAQKKKAADIVERVNSELNRYLENADDENSNQHKADLFSFRKDRLKEMVETLTADQKAAWTELLGEAPTGFEVEDLWLKIEQDANTGDLVKLGE
jgi:hypothetical protein